MSEVDAYVSRVDAKLRRHFERLRSLVKKALPGASESIKWGVPYYALDGVGVASIADYSKHVNLYLMQGAQLSSNLLKGTGKGMRHVTIEVTATDVDETEILRLLREAGKLAAGEDNARRTGMPRGKNGPSARCRQDL
jgi:hypothetical protein